jgi:hypothetical protein
MAEDKDIAAKPLSFMWAWGLPLLVLFSLNFAPGVLPLSVILVIMSGVFVWMGLACMLNARRCRRRHCYYSGPIFLIGAVAVLLVGFNVISLGRDGLMIVVWGTLALALLTFATEPVFGKYVR